jgi:hypothetical protein
VSTGAEAHFDPGLVADAIVAYVGRGETPRPGRSSDAVRALAPAGRQEELLALVRLLNTEADTVEIDLSEAENNSLVPAFTRRMRVRHPDLDDRAMDALCWASRYRQMFE